MDKIQRDVQGKFHCHPIENIFSCWKNELTREEEKKEEYLQLDKMTKAKSLIQIRVLSQKKKMYN